MIVFLIGFMGSGKSTVGRKLSRQTGWAYKDLDTLIEEKEDLSVQEIFNLKGEEGFRKIETEVLRNITTNKNLIISCGGGTPCFNNNMDWMNSAGYTIYLELSVGALKSRLLNAKVNRPLISGLSDSDLDEYISKTLSEREEFYKKAKEIVQGLDLNITQLSDRLEHLHPYNP